MQAEDHDANPLVLRAASGLRRELSVESRAVVYEASV
jgi:hypothetical protein